jgi:heme/copper-type cytochrome/quinol oxidase subunit 2
LLAPDPASSSTGSEINTLYWIALAIAAVLILLINVGLISMLVRGRASKGGHAAGARARRGSTLAVGGLLAALAIGVFVVGVVFTEKAGVETTAASAADSESQMDGSDTEAMAARGEKTLQILTSGQQWLWRYQYPDGTFSYYELVLPVGQPVEIELESTDVLHRWWVPGLSQKADAVPGKTHVLKFTPDTEGTFEGASYAFSGANYATMRTVVRVVSEDEFERWLDEQGAEIADAQKWVQDEIAKNGPYGAIEEAGGGQ